MANICTYIPDPNILTQAKVNREFTLIHKHLCYLEAAIGTIIVTTTSTTTTTTTTLSLLSVTNTTSAGGAITINPSDSGKVFSNKGAAQDLSFILPNATTIGLHYYFANVAPGHIMTIDAKTGDTITVTTATSSAGGTAFSIGSQEDDFLHLVAVATNKWVSLADDGNWNVS